MHFPGAGLQNSTDSLDSVEANQPTNIKTKKLFVTGKLQASTLILFLSLVVYIFWSSNYELICMYL